MRARKDNHDAYKLVYRRVWFKLPVEVRRVHHELLIWSQVSLIENEVRTQVWSHVKDSVHLMSFD